MHELFLSQETTPYTYKPNNFRLQIFENSENITGMDVLSAHALHVLPHDLQGLA